MSPSVPGARLLVEMIKEEIQGNISEVRGLGVIALFGGRLGIIQFLLLPPPPPVLSLHRKDSPVSSEAPASLSASLACGS